ncbi:hypothetical protein B296_00042176 [Ensete ventricosum]|uniref:Uncharacterized protein n=1 Tax=Ensete ventricosum TaxID=4639 RepID=A0A426XNJ8_ENSVE|nr:hypothetical protein B296_00042176 [Ensete ventricosum]
MEQRPPIRIASRASNTKCSTILHTKGVMTWKPKVSTVTGIAGQDRLRPSRSMGKRTQQIAPPDGQPNGDDGRDGAQHQSAEQAKREAQAGVGDHNERTEGSAQHAGGEDSEADLVDAVLPHGRKTKLGNEDDQGHHVSPGQDDGDGGGHGSGSDGGGGKAKHSSLTIPPPLPQLLLGSSACEIEASGREVASSTCGLQPEEWAKDLEEEKAKGAVRRRDSFREGCCAARP